MAVVKRDFSELVDYVKEEFKRDDKDDVIETSINETLEWMSQNHGFNELQAECYVPTVVGQEDYKLADDMLEIHHPIKILEDIGDGRNSSYQMWHWTKEEYDRHQPNPNTSQTPSKAKPYAYCIWRGAILVHPIPDKATYKLEVPHQKNLTRLVADVDEHPFNPTWEELIKEGTLQRLKAKLGLLDEAHEHALNFLYGYYNPQTGERKGGWNQMVHTDDANSVPARTVRPRYF